MLCITNMIEVKWNFNFLTKTSNEPQSDSRYTCGALMRGERTFFPPNDCAMYLVSQSAYVQLARHTHIPFPLTNKTNLVAAAKTRRWWFDVAGWGADRHLLQDDYIYMLMVVFVRCRLSKKSAARRQHCMTEHEGCNDGDAMTSIICPYNVSTHTSQPDVIYSCFVRIYIQIDWQQVQCAKLFGSSSRQHYTMYLPKPCNCILQNLASYSSCTHTFTPDVWILWWDWKGVTLFMAQRKYTNHLANPPILKSQPIKRERNK